MYNMKGLHSNVFAMRAICERLGIAIEKAMRNEPIDEETFAKYIEQVEDMTATMKYNFKGEKK